VERPLRPLLSEIQKKVLCLNVLRSHPFPNKGSADMKNSMEH